MPADRRRPHPAEAPQIAPGTIVADKYVVEDVLGTGSMGFVVSATHKLIGQKVAIKFIKTEFVESEDALSRFKREARALVQVQSENVVRVFDYGTMRDESPYLVMEFLTGRDLQRELRARRTIPVEEAAEIIVQACEGLAAVHARGIVHRDIKPANLFLTQRANARLLVKIVDFGISKAPKLSEDDVTITKGSIGSPHYMSPEQLRNSRSVDARSDIWSLGVTLYRALTGELPFAGETVATLLAAVVATEPRNLRELRPDLSPEIEAVVRKCLEKNWDDRYGSAQELADALSPFAMPSKRSFASLPERIDSSPPPHESTPMHESTSRAHIAPVSGALGEPGAPWRPRAALAAAIGVPLVLVTLALRFAPAEKPVAARRATEAPSATATTVASVPIPASANQAAVAAYMAGVQAVRDASLVEAPAAFDRASSLDPTMAAAHLRAAVFGDWPIGSESRRHARAALALRASLSEADRELLGAVEPLYLPPQPAFAEAEKRVDKLVAARPGDPELLFLSAFLFLHHRSHDELAKIADRVTALDPRLAAAGWLRALVRMLDGDRAEAKAAVDGCLGVAPAAASCLRIRATIEDLDGDCGALEADARRMTAMEDESARGYDFLARSLYARGRSLDAVRDALDQKWKATPERARSAIVLRDEALLASATGDFVTALREVGTLDRTAQAGGTEDERRDAALLAIDVDTELGDVQGAAQIADAYLKRLAAGAPAETIDADPRPRLYAVAARGGLRSAAERDDARGAWVTLWSPQLESAERSRIWIEGYAYPAETREDAEVALAALPSYAPIPWIGFGGTTAPAAAKVYALAGEARKAIPDLEQASRSCRALAAPFDQMRSALRLGQASEATGDTPGACAAYGLVLAHWGTAKRSVTAAAASARAKAIGCAR
jgi:serine/threonine protein kinase